MRVTIKRTEKDGKITLQESGSFAIVTIHRPDLKNALTNRMWEDLTAIGRRIPENPKNKVVILRLDPILNNLTIFPLRKRTMPSA